MYKQRTGELLLSGRVAKPRDHSDHFYPMGWGLETTYYHKFYQNFVLVIPLKQIQQGQLNSRYDKYFQHCRNLELSVPAEKNKAQSHSKTGHKQLQLKMMA